MADLVAQTEELRRLGERRRMHNNDTLLEELAMQCRAAEQAAADRAREATQAAQAAAKAAKAADAAAEAEAEAKHSRIIEQVYLVEQATLDEEVAQFDKFLDLVLEGVHNENAMDRPSFSKAWSIFFIEVVGVQKTDRLMEQWKKANCLPVATKWRKLQRNDDQPD